LNPYRHTQVGWAVVLPVLLVFVVVLGMTAFTPETRGTLLLIAGFVVVMLSLFGTLTVTVADGWLECHLGVGFIRRRIRLADVQRAEAVRNKWYYGWGIRLTPHGWLWNVAGLNAVELTFANGKRFRIGTDEPGRLLEAIHSGVGRRIPPA
jgi:hypothetical protein